MLSAFTPDRGVQRNRTALEFAAIVVGLAVHSPPSKQLEPVAAQLAAERIYIEHAEQQFETAAPAYALQILSGAFWTF
jgi:hypothetical protein